MGATDFTPTPTLLDPTAAVTTYLDGDTMNRDRIVVEASPIVKESKAETASPAPGYYKVVMSSRVSYADLDLAKPADVATAAIGVRTH